MQEPGNVFRTGTYHKSFQQKHNHLIRTAQLRVFYRTSARLITSLGWPDPVAKDAPQVLLCGTASPYTTATFARFVRKRNATARLHVLDISSSALDQSERFLRACQDIDQTKVSFIEGDALRMPFPNGHFDWIETDFFLQFFSAHEKRPLFQEWYRVLKPGGIITTRDWLQHKHNFVERVIDQTKNWLIRHILGPIACSADVQELRAMLHESGFQVAFFPVKIPIMCVRLPMMHYILLYKPCNEKA